MVTGKRIREENLADLKIEGWEIDGEPVVLQIRKIDPTSVLKDPKFALLVPKMMKGEKVDMEENATEALAVMDSFITDALVNPRIITDEERKLPMDQWPEETIELSDLGIHKIKVFAGVMKHAGMQKEEMAAAEAFRDE